MTHLPNLHHWQEAERAMTAGPDGLLRCPFCDSNAIFGRIREKDDRRYMVLTAECANYSCDAKIEASLVYREFKDMSVNDISKALHAKATVLWNARADTLSMRDPALLAAIAGVAEAMQEAERRLASEDWRQEAAELRAALANLNAALARE